MDTYINNHHGECVLGTGNCSHKKGIVAGAESVGAAKNVERLPGPLEAWGWRGEGMM